MILPIVQLGDPVLRRAGRAVRPEELRGAEMQRLIDAMRETMRHAPGVGLAAPQVGLPLQLAVIEDRVEPRDDAADGDDLDGEAAARDRRPVPFHVLVNPVLRVADPMPLRFFEGCLSLSGFVGVVARARGVRVECLDEKGRPRRIDASGWYARILQHEIDHLNGTVYVDRMETRTFMAAAEHGRHWGGVPTEVIRQALDAARPLPGSAAGGP